MSEGSYGHKIREYNYVSGDGVLIDTVSEFVGTKETDEYVRIYKKSIFNTEILTLQQKGFLFDIVDFIGYGNILDMDGGIKDMLCSDKKKSRGTISNLLGELVKIGVLFRIGMAKYLVNPHLISCGRDKIIRQLKYQVTFNKGKGIWEYDPFLKREKFKRPKK